MRVKEPLYAVICVHVILPQMMAELQKKRKEKEKFMLTYDEDISKSDEGKPVST